MGGRATVYVLKAYRASELTAQSVALSLDKSIVLTPESNKLILIIQPGHPNEMVFPLAELKTSVL